MQVQYICSRINDLMQDIKDAKEFEDEEAFKHDLRGLRKLIKALSESAKEEREDGAFFEGELEDKEEPKQTIGAHVKKEDSCDKEHDDSCDHVKAFRERRQKRLDAKEEEKGRWVTTENDHKVHLNEEGVPDKGNPFCH